MTQISYFRSQPDPVSLEELEGGVRNLGKAYSGGIRMKLGGENKHKS